MWSLSRDLPAKVEDVLTLNDGHVWAGCYFTSECIDELSVYEAATLDHARVGLPDSVSLAGSRRRVRELDLVLVVLEIDREMGETSARCAPD